MFIGQRNCQSNVLRCEYRNSHYIIGRRQSVDRVKLQIEIDPKYADDITFIRSEEAKINRWKELCLVCYEKKDSRSTRVRRKVRYQQIQRQKIEILQVSWLTNWHWRRHQKKKRLSSWQLLCSWIHTEKQACQWVY